VTLNIRAGAGRSIRLSISEEISQNDIPFPEPIPGLNRSKMPPSKKQYRYSGKSVAGNN